MLGKVHVDTAPPLMCVISQRGGELRAHHCKDYTAKVPLNAVHILWIGPLVVLVVLCQQRIGGELELPSEARGVVGFGSTL